MKGICDTKSKCSGCGACAEKCPKSCVTMALDEEGFLYPKISKEECINCGLCRKVCMANHTQPEHTPTITACAAYSIHSDIRENSSSGGVFSELAEWVIKQSGIVYGVRMADDCKSAAYTKVEDIKGIAGLRGSKYIQAETAGIYHRVKIDLDNGKRVLFSGTPCITNALHLYLDKEYDNLLCVDVICHGASSPKVWSKYCEEKEKRYNASIMNVNFRSKRYSWGNFGIEILDARHRKLYINKDEDDYMRLFLGNMSIRPSCYSCTSKKVRYADITLGDFWGVERVLPEMDDERGLSMVIMRTDTGRMAMSAICESLMQKEISYDTVKECNVAECESVPQPVSRSEFFRELDVYSTKKLANKYCPISTKQRVIRQLVKAKCFLRAQFLSWGGMDRR